uniref:18S rRNA (guanine-N(7))-methyltransferase n=1 Tax=Prolemur simus TaxID=1328070 RepID=A0A8C9A604_PROSS
MAFRGRRPEHGGPPELFYDENEARKYVRNSRMIDVQTRMAGRALELLCLPEGQPCYLLDIGCGSGLSGNYLSDEGHYWVGIDISPAMLDAALDRDTEGDLLLGDMGQGIPFRPGTFDGCISISAVQWLCNANKKSDIPAKRLYCFFSSLYSVLVRGARAILQLYPENSEQLELITTQATRAGFTGGVVVDYPNMCCLAAGGRATQWATVVLGGHQGPAHSCVSGLRVRLRMARRAVVRKSRAWVLEKKERRRRQGKAVRPDTQYTGRKRKPRF